MDNAGIHRGDHHTPVNRVHAPVVRFAASKVALLIGLHEFGDLDEAVLEHVYQDHEELLVHDAALLGLDVVSEEEQLAKLIAKTGSEVQAKLDAILYWTQDRQQPAAQQTAAQLLQQVDGLVAQARGKRKLETEEAREVKKQLQERIRQSYGCRNENLAIKTYEKQHGCTVRLSNEAYYLLQFPQPETGVQVDYATVEASIVCKVSKSRRVAGVDDDVELDRDGNGDADLEASGCDATTQELIMPPLFTICGMIDGMADTVRITGDDDWELVPILVEVKNRVHSFRIPPPLYDYIQMAVYLKMVGASEGDLIQCLHTDQARIHVTRVSMSEHPLKCKVSSSASGGGQAGGELWSSVLLPRLYAVVAMVLRLRTNDLQRLAFLNASEAERMDMLRRECDFL